MGTAEQPEPLLKVAGGKVIPPEETEKRLALAREALMRIAEIDEWDRTCQEASWNLGRLGGEASTPRHRLRQCGQLANAALRHTGPQPK